jgi:hypothetical protein
MILVSSSLLLLLSRERASKTLFCTPLNHWLYDLSPSNMKRVACIQAASICADAWMGLLPNSVKFDFSTTLQLLCYWSLRRRSLGDGDGQQGYQLTEK